MILDLTNDSEISKSSSSTQHRTTKQLLIKDAFKHNSRTLSEPFETQESKGFESTTNRFDPFSNSKNKTKASIGSMLSIKRKNSEPQRSVSMLPHKYEETTLNSVKPDERVHTSYASTSYASTSHVSISYAHTSHASTSHTSTSHFSMNVNELPSEEVETYLINDTCKPFNEDLSAVIPENPLPKSYPLPPSYKSLCQVQDLRASEEVIIPNVF